MDSNKENQEQEEAPSELPSVASPRISSVGASEDPAGSSRPVDQFQHPPQPYELTSGHDHLHWGGVGRRVGQQPHDTRSIASSAATRDDKSIYEEPGPLDATEEGVERGDEEEEAEEIALTQVQGELREAAPLQPEGSAADSAYTAISGGGSLAEVMDQLANQAVAGELSPRQAAAAIRTATHGLGPSAGGDDSVTASGDPPASIQAADALRELSLQDAEKPSADQPADSPVVEAPGIPESPAASTAGSPESPPAAATGGSPEALLASEAGIPDLPLAATAGTTEHTTAMATAQAVPESMHAVEGAGTAMLVPEGGAHAADEQAPSEAAAAVTDSPAQDDPLPVSLSAEEAAAADRECVMAALAAEPDDVAEALAAAEEEASAAVQPPAPPAGVEQEGSPDGAAASAPAAGPNFESRFMQQLAASASEDDLAVYTADSGGVPQEAVRPPSPPEQPQARAQPQPAQRVQQEAVPSAHPPSAMQPLSVDGVDRRTSEATAALAAINASGGAASQVQDSRGEEAPRPGLLFPPSWYQTFNGLLYMDGVDALGRPVVVLNADAVPSNMKSSALIYVKAHLEPLVNQGDYVLVFTSRGAAKLPSMWIMGAYRSLPRPFRKNVQYVVLVRPSAFLRTVLAFMRPFVSKKAGRKIKQVDSVHDIAEATCGEVTVQSLGPAFAAEQLAATANSSPGGSP